MLVNKKDFIYQMTAVWFDSFLSYINMRALITNLSTYLKYKSTIKDNIYYKIFVIYKVYNNLLHLSYINLLTSKTSFVGLFVCFWLDYSKSTQTNF